jgi:hypothetical protein
MLKIAAVRLRPLLEELVFIGGSIIELFITDPAAMDIRETKDIDVIVETLTYAGYIDFTDRLRKIGFSNDVREGAPICRWVNDETTLDVMPIDEQILGFANKWYKSAFTNYDIVEIAADIDIKITRPEYFIATKIAAFRGRGENDYYGSHDLEDILAVIDGRPEFLDEIGRADAAVRNEVATFVSECLDNESFHNALPGHLASGSAEGRLSILLERLRLLRKI